MASSNPSPEYDSLRTYMHMICSSISASPHSLTPLTLSLCGERIVSENTKNSVTGTKGTAPYELAAQLLSSVHQSVQYDPKKFYIFARKLAESGNIEVSQKLLEECEKRGGKKAPLVSTTTEDLPDESIMANLFQQPPILRLFVKHIAGVLQGKWMQVGALLGIPHLQLKTIEASTSDKADAMIKVFEGWEKTDEVEFTWQSLFNELNSSSESTGIIDRETLTLLKKTLFEELSKQKNSKS